MVQLEKRRLPTALAAVIDVSAPRAIALPHLAPHGGSDRVALALARISFHAISLRLALAPARIGFHTVSLRLALALARIGFHTVSLRLALAPARFGRRGSRPFHIGPTALLQLRDKQAHRLQLPMFDRAVRQSG